MSKEKVECTGWEKYYTVRCNLEEYDVVERYDANVDYTSYEVVGVENGSGLEELVLKVFKEWREMQ